MTDGWVAMPSFGFGFDVNTALKPFGITYEIVMQLRDAGLLFHGDGIGKTFPLPPGVEQPEKHRVVMMNNGVFMEFSGAALSGQQIGSLIFTRSGRELQRLIEPAPNDQYLAALGASLRQRAIACKRGSLVPQDETTSLLVFEQDL